MRQLAGRELSRRAGSPTSLLEAADVRAGVRVVDPLTDRPWVEVVDDAPQATVFQSPAWLRVLSDSYGLKHFALVHGVQGIVLTHAGKRLVSSPFSDYGPPLVRDDPVGRHLVGLAIEATAADGLLELRGPSEIDLQAAGFTQSAVYLRHTVDLRQSFAHLEASFSPAARRGMRKAEHAGVNVRRSVSLQDMRRFYELVVETRRKQLLLPQPWRFFEAIQRHFFDTGNGWLLLAEHDGHVIAGDLLLAHGDVLTYKFNASATSSLELRPNNLLMATLIKTANAEGYRELDLGRCDLDGEGLRRYKLAWGAREERYPYFSLAKPEFKQRRSALMQDLLPRAVPYLPGWALRGAARLFYGRFA